MKSILLSFRFIIQIILLNLFFTNVNAFNVNKPHKAENLSNYFSGIVSLNENNYIKSYNYLKKILKGLKINIILIHSFIFLH